MPPRPRRSCPLLWASILGLGLSRLLDGGSPAQLRTSAGSRRARPSGSRSTARSTAMRSTSTPIAPRSARFEQDRLLTFLASVAARRPRHDPARGPRRRARDAISTTSSSRAAARPRCGACSASRTSSRRPSPPARTARRSPAVHGLGSGGRGARTAGSRWCSSATSSPCRPAPTGAGRAAPTSPTCRTATSAARPRPISA